VLLDTPATPRPGRLDPHLVTMVRPRSFESEQYCRLRQRLEDLAGARGLRVVAVTSAAAGDGKTLTAVNLAAVLARSPGARILLIDADLRHPSVAKCFGISNEGLTSWTEGMGTADAKIIERAISVAPGLDVLVATESPTDPYDILRSATFQGLIAEARRRYDYVILDTPPAIPVPDSALLGKTVDGYLLVVAANITPRALVREALSQFDPGAVVGLIFNRDTRPLFGYESKAYFQSYVRSLEHA
jgi:capsular exopolysaccharide synthesis family protein